MSIVGIVMGWAAVSEQGWVAEHSSTVAPHPAARKLMPRLNRLSSLPGTVCTSSMTMTLLHRLWNRRMLLPLPSKSVFSSCTRVVMMMGASQVSINNSVMERPLPLSLLRTMLEWCSKIRESSST